MKKDKLLHLVADLVEMLITSGTDTKSIISTLRGYGFKDSDIEEWYGLTYEN